MQSATTGSALMRPDFEPFASGDFALAGVETEQFIRLQK